MLYCLKKLALIFWVGNPARTQNIMAYSPELLGGEVDSDIPLLASYNGWHYQVYKSVCFWNISAQHDQKFKVCVPSPHI